MIYQVWHELVVYVFYCNVQTAFSQQKNANNYFDEVLDELSSWGLYCLFWLNNKPNKQKQEFQFTIIYEKVKDIVLRIEKIDL